MNDDTTQARHRDLDLRLRSLDASLARIGSECVTALETPQLSFVTVCRIAHLAQRALDPWHPGLVKVGARR